MNKLYISCFTYFCLIFLPQQAGTLVQAGTEHEDWIVAHQWLFSSCRHGRFGSHSELLLNLGSDFAELVLLISSNLAFICSALHTFPLQHQPFAFSLSFYADNLVTVMLIRIWEDTSQGGLRQKTPRLARITKRQADCLLKESTTI